MTDTYAYISQRSRRFTARVLDHNGQPIDSHDASSIRGIAEWLALYHPHALLAPATPACAIREAVA